MIPERSDSITQTKHRKNKIENISMALCKTAVNPLLHWARWHLKSPTYPLFAQPFVLAQIKGISKLCVTGLCEGNPLVTGGFHSQRASDMENVSIWWHHRVTHWSYYNLALSHWYVVDYIIYTYLSKPCFDSFTSSYVNSGIQPPCNWKRNKYL